jgi:hypothetical protein
MTVNRSFLVVVNYEGAKARSFTKEECHANLKPQTSNLKLSFTLAA